MDWGGEGGRLRAVYPPYHRRRVRIHPRVVPHTGIDLSASSRSCAARWRNAYTMQATTARLATSTATLSQVKRCHR